MNDGITVAIPSIPPRHALLTRALQSVYVQTKPADAISIALDHRKEGATRTRQRALDGVRTPFVAFLDDDDRFKPEHLDRLYTRLRETNADYVYSWFEVVGGRDPFPQTHFLNEFDPAMPVQTTITILVKTDLAQAVGFVDEEQERTVGDQRWGEDYTFLLKCINEGAVIKHLVERTWFWHHDSRNTSGLPTRW